MSESSDLCSSDGDFDLDSQLRVVPGIVINIFLERIGAIHITSWITIQGDVQVALLVDGSPWSQWRAEIDFSIPLDIQLAGVFQLSAGSHVIEVAARSVGAAGPRDWSPRWEKEGKPYGKIIRSPERPLRLFVTKV